MRMRRLVTAPAIIAAGVPSPSEGPGRAPANPRVRPLVQPVQRSRGHCGLRRPLYYRMRNLILPPGRLGLLSLFLLLTLLAGCNQLGLGGQPQRSTEVPTPRQLKQIRYMSQALGPNGRRVFDHLEQARSCHDLEIAMRWNRPPDVRGGPFNEKMVYVSSGIPANLPKDSEVFLTGVIKAGGSSPSGTSAWSLTLKDGSEIQAVESAEYVQKQEEAQQGGGKATMVRPYMPGRLLCVYGVYQGNIGLALDRHGRVPLISVLFAIDRRRYLHSAHLERDFRAISAAPLRRPAPRRPRGIPAVRA